MTGAWALIGFSNVVLWRASQDYFSLESQLNPFTHTWSLGVEEQFYLLYPAIFAMACYSWQRHEPTPKRMQLVLWFATGLSLAAYLATSSLAPTAAFYLMPTRFWELSIGGLIFIWSLKTEQRFASNRLAIASGFLLLGCFTVPGEWQTLRTVLEVVGTGSLILSAQRSPAVTSALASRPLVFVGKVSYSLYLWHWSVLVLGKWTIGASPSALFVMLLLTITMALLSYFFVEEPFRRGNWYRSNWSTLTIGALAIAASFYFVRHAVPGYGQSYNNNLPQFMGVTPPPAFPEVPCHGRKRVVALRDPLSECLLSERTAARPHRFTLLGDSHAAQLYPMASVVAERLQFSVRFINAEDQNEFPYSFLNGASTSKVLDFVTRHLRAGDLIVIAFHRGSFNNGRDKHIPLGEMALENNRTRSFYRGMRPYLAKWTQLGAQVILVKDTPLMRVVSTSSSCMLQIQLFGRSECRIGIEQDLHTRRRQDIVFDRLVSSTKGVYEWDPLPLIYRDRPYFDVADEKGRYLMWDWNHITEYQSRLLADPFQSFIQKRLSR